MNGAFIMHNGNIQRKYTFYVKEAPDQIGLSPWDDNLNFNIDSTVNM